MASNESQGQGQYWRLQFSISNDAFADNAPSAIAQVLRELAERIELTQDTAHRVRDINGNSIGQCGQTRALGGRLPA